MNLSLEIVWLSEFTGEMGVARTGTANVPDGQICCAALQAVATLMFAVRIDPTAEGGAWEKKGMERDVKEGPGRRPRPWFMG